MDSNTTLTTRELGALRSYRAGATLHEIGKQLGVTRERARQIINKALKKELAEKSNLGFAIDENIFITAEKAAHTRKRKPEKVQQPVEEKKEKRWSRYYTSCRSCGTTVIPHVRHGLCQFCSKGLRGEIREKFIKDNGGICQNCGITRAEAINKYGRDFYLNPDPRADKRSEILCRRCFGSHMGKSVGFGTRAWSEKYESCIKCGKTEYRHARNGLCEKCYGRPSGTLREQIIRERGSRCKVCGIKRDEAKKKYRRDLYLFGQGEGIDKLTLMCRGCFSKRPHAFD